MGALTMLNECKPGGAGRKAGATIYQVLAS